MFLASQGERRVNMEQFSSSAILYVVIGFLCAVACGATVIVAMIVAGAR